MHRHDEHSWSRRQTLAQVIGAAGLLLVAVIGFYRPAIMFRSYLVAFNFWLGIPLGCLVILMLHQLTGGAWGDALRPLLEAASGTLPLAALFFLPLLLGLGQLYPWASASQAAHDPHLVSQRLYLNTPFFIARAAVYFACWIVLAHFFHRWSRLQNGDPNSPAARRMRNCSGPGLVLYALTITFASIDWLMSLYAHWYSTIFPVIFGLGQILAAFAFAVAVLGLSDARSGGDVAVSRDTFQNLGSLLLAFVMLWAYAAFSQFLLIWSGNLPEEIEWYRPRLEGGWQWIALLLIICQFALPFLLLLSRDIKRDPRLLAGVALTVLAVHFVDLLWQILPAFPPDDVLGHSLDIVMAIVALLGIGGIWLAIGIKRLRQNLLPPDTFAAAGEEEAHG